MPASDAVLIDALVKAVEDSGGLPLERRQADLAVWFYHNYKRIPRDNLTKRLEFLERAAWCLLEITALQTERIQDMEIAKRSRNLWLPSGFTLHREASNGS